MCSKLVLEFKCVDISSPALVDESAEERLQINPQNNIDPDFLKHFPIQKQILEQLLILYKLRRGNFCLSDAS